MSRPEERADIDGGGEPVPPSSLSGASIASDGGGGGGSTSVLMSATVNDGRGVNGRRMLVATKSGSEDALPTADDHQHQRDSDDKTQTASPPHQLSRRRGVASPRVASPRGGRTYQFRKAKSAATFTLDGVSYTIGEYRTVYWRHRYFVGFVLTN